MIHDFAERLAFSEGIEPEPALLKFLLDSIPGGTRIRRATASEDRQGTDYWIERPSLPWISIDMKHRDFDPILRFGSDDVCVETTSVYTGPRQSPWLDEHRKRPGWTLDGAKRTTLLVYTWPREDGKRRFWVLYFPHLVTAAIRHWREWAEKYKERAAENANYITLSVYPPRAVVRDAMRELVSGII